MEVAQSEMPKYVCHKTVHALKIEAVEANPDGTCYITSEATEGAGPARVEVSREYIDQHAPESGGYYVVYKDGYKSYSPADAFENGYTRIDPKRVTQNAKPDVYCGSQLVGTTPPAVARLSG